MNIKCTKCQKIKESSLFCKDKNRKNGHTIWCKDCLKIYREKHRERARVYMEKYYIDNKEKIKDISRRYRENNPEKIKKYRRIYKLENKKKILEQNKEYRAKNKEKRNKYNIEWRQENPAKMREYYIKALPKSRIYNREKYHNDIQYRLAKNLRGRLRVAIKKQKRAGSAIRDLGCSLEKFKEYLENKFVNGMAWDNYGEWHIDHIKPLSKFDLTDRKQFLVACNYSNLQPLWGEDNRKKFNK